jgi:hypothetical protein
MQFGIYLVENGVITCEEFFEALKLQVRTRPTIGGLAIEKRKLNVRQVFSVLRQQCDSPADLFGELAVKAGYISGEELASLIHEQTTRVRPFSDILVELEILSPEVVDDHIREYRHVHEHADSYAVAHDACHA